MRGLLSTLFLLLLLAMSPTTWGARHTVKLTTFNVGLAHAYVPYAKERIDPLVRTLKRHDSDVLCLQEVWLAEDRDRITNFLKRVYPYSYYANDRLKTSHSAPTCGITELFFPGHLVPCLARNCLNKKDSAFSECLLNSCGRQLSELKQQNPDCLKALMAQVGRSPVRALLTITNPFRPAPLFTYGGAAGLLMLSRIPLENSGVIEMAPLSTMIRRAALSSDIMVNGAAHKLVCTHLTARLSSVPYVGSMKSWGHENAVQTRHLLSYLASLHPGQVYHVMGDFNFSPMLPNQGIEAELAENYQLMKSLGLHNVMVEGRPKCTFCRDNKLTDTDHNYLIDHIFSSYSGVKRASREFDYHTAIQHESDVITANFSDHYGVSLEIYLSPKAHDKSNDKNNDNAKLKAR